MAATVLAPDEIPVYFENTVHKMTGINEKTTTEDLVYAMLWFRNRIVDENVLQCYDVYISSRAKQQHVAPQTPILRLYRDSVQCNGLRNVRVDIRLKSFSDAESTSSTSSFVRTASSPSQSMSSSLTTSASSPDSRASGNFTFSSPTYYKLKHPKVIHETKEDTSQGENGEQKCLLEIVARQTNVLRDLDIRLRTVCREVEFLGRQSLASENGNPSPKTYEQLVAFNKRVELETQRVQCLTNALHWELLSCPDRTDATDESQPDDLLYSTSSLFDSDITPECPIPDALRNTRTMTQLLLPRLSSLENITDESKDLFITLNEVEHICGCLLKEEEDKCNKNTLPNDMDSDTGIGSISDEGVTYIAETLV